MASDAAWDDFEGPSSSSKAKPPSTTRNETDSETPQPTNERTDCDWGFGDNYGPDEIGKGRSGEESLDYESKFAKLYEQYLADKTTITEMAATKNSHRYKNDPLKTLKDWSEDEWQDLKMELKPCGSGEFVCSIDLCLCESDFAFVSEPHSKRQQAIHEVATAACKMLDACRMLFRHENGEREEASRKRHFDNKEDDIELDQTKRQKTAELTGRGSNASSGKAETHQSLMAQWQKVNMKILQTKAELVRLNLQVRPKEAKVDKAKESADKKIDEEAEVEGEEEEEEEEEDPLDAFMSTLGDERKPTLDDKIEKARLRALMNELERELERLTRLIELTKPLVDLSKAIGAPASTSSSAAQKTRPNG